MSAWIKSLVAVTGLMAVVSGQAQPVAVMNGAEPLPGITTAGQPDQAALEGFAKDGYAAVIDLRGVDEDRGFDEKTAVEELGMSYVPLPISGVDGISYENASALDALLEGIDGPVLLHCASSNRVGALLALRLKMNGGSSEEALDLGDAAGLTSQFRPVIEELLEQN